MQLRFIIISCYSCSTLFEGQGRDLKSSSNNPTGHYPRSGVREEGVDANQCVLNQRPRPRLKSRLVWAWVAYQTVKGIITLSLIWIPLLLLWLNAQ